MRPTLISLLVAWLWLSAAPSLAQSYPTPGYPVPASAEPQPPSDIAPRTATLLRVLEEDLNVLANASDGRVLDGTLQVVVGAAFVGVGFAVNDELLASILWLGGGTSLLRGVNQLAIAPNASVVNEPFQNMPALTPRNVRNKLNYGEAALFWVARRQRTARIVDGTLTMLGAAGYVPLYWGMRRADDPSYKFGDDTVDYLGLTLSGVGFALGLVTALVKSNAERRAEAYREAKARFRAESPGEFAFLPSFDVNLSQHGGSLRAGFRF